MCASFLVQPTIEMDFRDEHKVTPMFHCGQSTKIHTQGSVDHGMIHNIKVEDKQPELCQEDRTWQEGPRSNIPVINDFKSLKHEEEQEAVSEQQNVFQMHNTDQLSAWTGQCELATVKQERFCPDEYDIDGNNTRHWVVCEAGLLKEVKGELQETRATENHSVNSDQQKECSGGHFVYVNSMQSCVKPFICKVCGKSFNDAISLEMHETIHTVGKQHACVTCGKSFLYYSGLERHEMTHTYGKPFSCDMCGKSFLYLSGLKVHRKIHTGERPYGCSVCGKSFMRKEYLVRHEVIHTGVKPFSCATCGKSFMRSASLKVHEMLHTNERPFTCAKCGKSFVRSSDHKVHQRIHTGERPFTCLKCGKSFTRKCSLTSHEMIHTSEKQFSCGTCERSFMRKEHLRRHEVTHTSAKLISLV